jgi:plastocyanin
VFSYAAVIDNNTTDPIFVVGAEDQPFQATTPSAPTVTATLPPPTPTSTPTPPPSAEHVVEIGAGLRFRDSVSDTSTTTITAGTTVRWNWVGGFHSTTGPFWDSGQHSPPHTFIRQFNTAGTFNYECSVHGAMMSGTVIVNP